MDERWAPISSAPGYEVSTMGRVRSIERVVVDAGAVRRRTFKGKVLTPWADGSGHLVVGLHLGGRRRARHVHTLVLESFVCPRPPGKEGRHANGDHADNRLVNLSWGTHAENMQDAIRHGVNARLARTHCPREHLLIAPNLMACCRYRSCLACDRARKRLRYWSVRGIQLDMRAESDHCYAEIMKQTAA